MGIYKSLAGIGFGLIFGICVAEAAPKDTCDSKDPKSKVAGYTPLNQKLKVCEIVRSNFRRCDESPKVYFVKFVTDGSDLPSVSLYSCDPVAGVGRGPWISFVARDKKESKPLYKEAALFMSDLTNGYISDITFDLTAHGFDENSLVGLSYTFRGDDGKSYLSTGKSLSKAKNHYDSLEVVEDASVGSPEHKRN